MHKAEENKKTVMKQEEAAKMLIPRYYENLHMLHENTMPNRSYYIPASKMIRCLPQKILYERSSDLLM